MDLLGYIANARIVSPEPDTKNANMILYFSQISW